MWWGRTTAQCPEMSGIVKNEDFWTFPDISSSRMRYEVFPMNRSYTFCNTSVWEASGAVWARFNHFVFFNSIFASIVISGHFRTLRARFDSVRHSRHFRTLQLLHNRREGHQSFPKHPKTLKTVEMQWFGSHKRPHCGIGAPERPRSLQRLSVTTSKYSFVF